MSARFSMRRRVEFADTDVAGIMHFSNFFRFMEVCEHSFMRSLGLSVHPSGEGRGAAPVMGIGWPRVHAECDFKKSLKFEEEVEIELVVGDIRTRTVDYHFQFWKNPDDGDDRILAASGCFTVVCVSWDDESKEMKAVEIPEEVRKQLEGATEG